MRQSGRILIISAKAGAGHMRAAAAIEEALRQRHPSVDVRNIDALEYTNASFRKSYTGTYNRLATKLPSVWGLLYDQFEHKPADSKTKQLSSLIDRLNARPLIRAVKEFDPDAIVCTHYLPAEILGRRRRQKRLRAKLSVVLTDYDIHTMWVQNGVDRYYVATNEMAHALEVVGIGQAEVKVTGIPVMPVFAEKFPDKRAMRRKLGLRVRPKTVLLSAGGYGMTRLDQVVESLVRELGDAQFLAVAGKNEKLHKQLEGAAESLEGKLVPFGFVTNMHELMAASDFMAAKCGGLTSSECLAMGLPMVIVNPIPGQEERNSDFLLESGAALRANSPAHLLFKIHKLLKDDRLLTRMRAAARRTGRPQAAFDIAADTVADT